MRGQFPKIPACSQAPSQVSHFPQTFCSELQVLLALSLGSLQSGYVGFTRMSDVMFSWLQWVLEHYHGINNTSKSLSD